MSQPGRIRAFTADDLDAAGGLLQERHERHRSHLPMLAPIDARAAVEHAWVEASGGLAAADASGAVQGYLLWRLRDNEVWGPFAWVDRASHACNLAEVTRDLYAAAAERWVEAGVRNHAVVVPAVPADLDPWERLAFARMQVHALRALPDDQPPPDVRIRRSGPAEVDRDVAPFADEIWVHQADAPTLTGLTPPTWDQMRGDWLETLAEDSAVHLVLDAHGQPAGHALMYAADAALGWPPTTARLAAVVVGREHRGQGFARALTDAVFAAARDAGFRYIETDWRIANLEASRTWPRMGFEPAFHRLWRVAGTG